MHDKTFLAKHGNSIAVQVYFERRDKLLDTCFQAKRMPARYINCFPCSAVLTIQGYRKTIEESPCIAIEYRRGFLSAHVQQVIQVFVTVTQQKRARLP